MTRPGATATRTRSLDTRLGQLNLRIPKLLDRLFPPSSDEEDDREGPGLGHPGGLRSPGLSAEGRRSVQTAGHKQDQQEPGFRSSARRSTSGSAHFLKQPLDGDWPYLWLDATYLKVREGGRIVSVAAIIAMAVSTEGRREIVGLHIGPSEAEPFWASFLKDLVRRGLKGREAGDLGRP